MTRKCGDCQLCCRLLPTEEIGKGDNCRCQHQRAGKGCAIYANRPMSCQLWSCRWLLNDDTADQQRPDRSHIVVDIMPDIIKVTENETGRTTTMGCLVAWVDPDYPDAWKAPAFHRYLLRQTMPVLLRLTSRESIGVIAPPAVTGLDHLVFKDTSLGQDMPHTLQEKAAALGASLDMPPDGVPYQPATMTMPDGRQITVATVFKDPK